MKLPGAGTEGPRLPRDGGAPRSGGEDPAPPGRSERHTPAPGQPWTPILLTRWSGEYLREKGVDAGRLEAELLLAHVLGLKRLDLYLQHDRPLQERELAAFKVLLRRRASREPLQYVLGRTAFRELELGTDRRALIPRPETEVLVELVLGWVRRSVEGAEPGASRGSGPGALPATWTPPIRALDLGTGTGAIALSLLREGPFGGVVATDPSAAALSLAAENARAAGLMERLELREGPLFEPLRTGERFHVIVSNPPYVPEGDRAGLQPEVREWEPPEALFAGPEGLDVLRPLVWGASEHLLPGGLLALEVGDGQASRVARLLEERGAFQEVSLRPDFAGRWRVVLGVASADENADL